MKYIKLFENFEGYDPYELMIIPPNKKTEMIFKEIEKKVEANLNLVEDLITLGANLDWQDGDGRTALYMCAIINRPEILRMLIDAGADVNIQRDDGMSVLHSCVFWNRPELAKMLVDAGADKTIPNNNGKLPYELAIPKELYKILKV